MMKVTVLMENTSPGSLIHEHGLSLHLSYRGHSVLLDAGSLNMGAVTILIGLAASMASLTPSAAVPSPLFFGPEHLTMKNTVKINLLFIFLSFVVLMLFAYPFAQLIIRS